MNDNSVSIIIPNYNGKKLLERNLPKVIETVKNENVEIIVVDDASSDGSLDLVKKNFPNIVVIEKNINRGFSSTINSGVEEASGDIVFLLNHDVYPSKNFLSPITSHFKNSQVFAVGCLQKSREGRKTVLRGRGIGSFQKGFLVHKRGRVDKKNTLWVSGGAGAFRKSIWNKLGGLDEIYNPFYWEDIDLSYRAVKAGYKIIFEPKSVVVHQQQEGAIRSNYSQYDIKKIAYRNQFIFHWKNITDKKFILSHFFWLPVHLLSAILRSDWALLAGFFSAIFMLPKILKKRRLTKKFSKRSDWQVINEFRKE